MANMTFTRGYITIIAKTREDVAKFIHLVNKYLGDLEYYTYIPGFEKMGVKDILDNLDEKISKDYHLDLDLKYEGFESFSFFFNGAGRWKFYNNIEDLKTDIEKLAAQDEKSLKTLDEVKKSGIKFVFDYTEDDSARLTISKCINITDFEINQMCLEIKSVDYPWMSENLREFCSYDEWFNLNINSQVALINHLIKSNGVHKKNLKTQKDSEKLLKNWKYHYDYIYLNFFNTGASTKPKKK